jgi:hypothetical protein
MRGSPRRKSPPSQNCGEQAAPAQSPTTRGCKVRAPPGGQSAGAAETRQCYFYSPLPQKGRPESRHSRSNTTTRPDAFRGTACCGSDPRCPLTAAPPPRRPRRSSAGAFVWRRGDRGAPGAWWAPGGYVRSIVAATWDRRIGKICPFLRAQPGDQRLLVEWRNCRRVLGPLSPGPRTFGPIDLGAPRILQA